MTDEELRGIIQHSPDTGFRAMFDKYHRYVYTVVFSVLGSCGCSKDIDNCVVDVFTDVILHFDSSRDGSLQAYIGTAARNKAISLKKNIFKRTERTIPIDDISAELSDNTSVAEDAERSELTDILLDRINSLGKPDSDIIINKYFFCRNSREIGEILGLSPAAVRVRCRRALKKLRTLLEELDITL